MKRLSIALIMACGALAQTTPRELKIWFADGAALAIQTQSTASQSPLSTSGSVQSAPSGEWHRVVLDSAGKVMFAYDIHARKVGAEAVMVRIEPAAGDKSKTLASVRLFEALRPGDTVSLDILKNPATGEKIFDRLRIIDEPASGRPPAKPSATRISLEKVRIAIDGKTIHEETNTWFTGAAYRIWLPDRGAYYLAVKPPSGWAFDGIGSVNKNVLRFPVRGEMLELTARSNILTNAESGTVWVFYNKDSMMEVVRARTFRAQLANVRQRLAADHPDVRALEKKLAEIDRPLSISCADDINWLMQCDKGPCSISSQE